MFSTSIKVIFFFHVFYCGAKQNEPIKPDSTKSFFDSEKFITSKTKICLGENNFKKILTNKCLYVDKSMLIYEVLRETLRIELLYVPHKWGKTLNMQMLKTFLELEVNDQCHHLSAESRINRKFFVGGTILSPEGQLVQLHPLKIAQHEDFIAQYQGNFPVIYLDFSKVTGNNYQEIMAGIKTQIQTSFREHPYLAKCYNGEQSEMMNERAKARFLQYTETNETLRDEQLPLSLYFLSNLLRKQFKKSIYIIIDGYDIPLLQSITNFENERERQLLHAMYKKIFGNSITYYGNSFNFNIKQTVLASTMPIEISWKVPQVCLYYQVKARISHFAFTLEEVKDLISKVPINTTLEELREYYNGYKFNDQMYFNPSSIMSVIKNEGKLMPYWNDKRLLRVANTIRDVDFNRNQLINIINQNYSIKSTYLKEMRVLPFQNYDNKHEYLFSTLYHGGYITGNVMLKPPLINLFNVSITNKEVEILLKKEFNLPGL